MNYIFAHFEQIILAFVLCLKLKSVSDNSHWVLQRSKNQRLQTTEFTMLISTNLYVPFEAILRRIYPNSGEEA